MGSLIRDVPRVGWVVTELIVVRTCVVALTIVGFGKLIDDPANTTLLATLCVGTVLAGILLIIENVVPQRLRALEEARWRKELAHINLTLDPDTSREDAHIITEATEATQKASTYTVLYLGPLFAAIIAPLSVLVVIGVAISWTAATLMLLGVALIPLVIGWAMQLLRNTGARYGRASMQIAAIFLESVRAMGTIMLLTATKQRRERIVSMSEKMRIRVMGLLYKNQLMILVTDGIFGLATTTIAAVISLVGLSSGSLTLGQAIALVILSRLFIDPINRMGRTFYTGISGKAGLEQVRAALGAKTTTISTTQSAQVLSGDLELADVSLSRNSNQIINNISFHLPRGKHLAIVGPSGSGKSTLGLALAGLHDFEGTITIGSQQCTPEALRDSVAYVPQSATLFSGTLADNLDLAGAGVETDNSAEILERAQLPLDMKVGELGRNVSGGEGARIAVARGLVKNAEVLLLDEATANLDTANAALLRTTARNTGMTLIEITHRPAEALDADLVLVFEQGHISAFGPAKEVAETSEFFARALQEEQ